MEVEGRATGRIRRERRDAVANRRRLRDAARVALAEQGMSVSVNSIARAAGVGVGTLYRKYPTKADLVGAILLELQDEVATTITERTAGAVSPEAELLGLVEAHLVVLQRIGALDALLRREAASLAARLEPGELLERFLGPLRTVLEHGVTTGTFREDLDVDLVGRAFFGMLDSHVVGDRVARDGVEAIARECTGMLLHGITVRSPVRS